MHMAVRGEVTPASMRAVGQRVCMPWLLHPSASSSAASRRIYAHMHAHVILIGHHSRCICAYARMCVHACIWHACGSYTHVASSAPWPPRAPRRRRLGAERERRVRWHLRDRYLGRMGGRMPGRSSQRPRGPRARRRKGARSRRARGACLRVRVRVRVKGARSRRARGACLRGRFACICMHACMCAHIRACMRACVYTILVYACWRQELACRGGGGEDRA